MRYLIILMTLGMALRSNKCPDTYTLLSHPTLFVGCGNLLFSYEFLMMDNRDSSTFLGIIFCPDGYDKDFFKKNGKYCIEFSKDSSFIKTTLFAISNHYENDSLLKKKVIKDIKPIGGN